MGFPEQLLWSPQLALGPASKLLKCAKKMSTAPVCGARAACSVCGSGRRIARCYLWAVWATPKLLDWTVKLATVDQLITATWEISAQVKTSGNCANTRGAKVQSGSQSWFKLVYRSAPLRSPEKLVSKLAAPELTRCKTFFLVSSLHRQRPKQMKILRIHCV